MKIFIGADHGGFELKNKIVEMLNNTFGHDVEDLGAHELNPNDDYPIFAEAVAKSILGTPESIGILICKTGIGMSIAANKFKGISAALAVDEDHAARSKEHNNANILCLDSEFITDEENLKIVEKFLNTPFSNEERHVRRINLIDQI